MITSKIFERKIEIEMTKNPKRGEIWCDIELFPSAQSIKQKEHASLFLFISQELFEYEDGISNNEPDIILTEHKTAYAIDSTNFWKCTMHPSEFWNMEKFV